MTILIDMNLSPEWVPYFMAKGIAAVHWREIGPAKTDDEEIAHHAAQHRMIVMTNDLDFTQLLAETQGRDPSVIQIRGDLLQPEDIGEPLVSALLAAAEDLRKGAVLTFDGYRTRVRVLPFSDD